MLYGRTLSLLPGLRRREENLLPGKHIVPIPRWAIGREQCEVDAAPV
jgi:hypothetical protein